MSGTIPSFSWQKLETGMEDCEFGFRVALVKDRYVLYDPEKRMVEVLAIPSGRFSLFYMTI